MEYIYHTLIICGLALGRGRLFVLLICTFAGGTVNSVAQQKTGMYNEFISKVKRSHLLKAQHHQAVAVGNVIVFCRYTRTFQALKVNLVRACSKYVACFLITRNAPLDHAGVHERASSFVTHLLVFIAVSQVLWMTYATLHYC